VDGAVGRIDLFYCCEPQHAAAVIAFFLDIAAAPD
jgi:hypothetical protein